MAIRKPARRKTAAASKRTKKQPASVWEKIVELGSRIPDEELAKLPRDGAQQVDHYLYGTPKRD